MCSLLRVPDPELLFPKTTELSQKLGEELGEEIVEEYWNKGSAFTLCMEKAKDICQQEIDLHA